jgi:hypothetical protein
MSYAVTERTGYSRHILDTGHTCGNMEHYGDNKKSQEGKVFEQSREIPYIFLISKR